MGGPSRRGDSGGGVSQPISDTGEPLFTYGVASCMYFTRKKRKRQISSIQEDIVKNVKLGHGSSTFSDINVLDTWWRVNFTTLIGKI